jgi:uncharacterized protein YjbJ (UPF0337 family)
MDARLEQLMGTGKHAVGAVTGDDKLKREGRLEQFSGDVKQHTRRWTDQAGSKLEGAADHAKDFTHRRT